jgi:hypothetical protein
MRYPKAFLSVAFSFLLLAGSAQAVSPSPGFSISSFATPSDFTPEVSAKCPNNLAGLCLDRYIVTATNSGSEPTSGSVTFADTLPAGVTLEGIEFRVSGIEGNLSFLCKPPSGQLVVCHFPLPIVPDGTLQMVLDVDVEPGAAEGLELANTASVSGGGAAQAAVSKSNPISAGPTPFAFSTFGALLAGADGAPDTQAGGHPYELTTRIEVNNELGLGLTTNTLGSSVIESMHAERPVRRLKNIMVDLPVGVVGSAIATPQCPLVDLGGSPGGAPSHCPPDTRIGHIETNGGIGLSIDSPLYNMVPARGVAAEFGFYDNEADPHTLDTNVAPTPAGYVLRTTSFETAFIPGLSSIVVNVYGDPAAQDGSSSPPVALFTNPADCAGEPVVAGAHVDSWEAPGPYNSDGSPDFTDPRWASTSSGAPPVTGCDALRFVPEVKAQPTTNAADTPSGLEFELKVPQHEEPETLATPPLRKAVVTLPPGFTVDPSAGDGLATCSIAQIGWLGPDGPDGEPLANRGLTNFNQAQPACPEASKIGSLELTTPLLAGTLTGELYLASQNENPFHTTLAAYVVVADPTTGILIKLAGEFLPDPVTGQVTAVFDENPQLPFSDLKLHFFGGPRAELATPESCGTFTTSSVLTPWSAPGSGPPATPSDNFVIDEACPGGFNPSFTAGSTNLQAGAYTPFVVSFQRSDADQELQGLAVTLPPGLLADVGSVPLCGEADANAGTCPEASQVGTALTTVGPGPNPLQVEGKAYLTGPYNNGPYGLSVVVPAIIGNPAHPTFNFGTVVVRQSIRIDPNTAQVTDVSDPFPTIIAGIPLRLRRVDVTLNRPGFTFNPTSCAKLGFTGTISGSPLGSPRRLAGNIGYATQPGASSSFTTPFQVTNCTSLKFQPKFAVSAKAAKNTRLDGATLTAKLSYPSAPQGTYTNIARVKVELPKALPSRLTTLRQACTATQFNANPAGCPSASKIGFAVVHTPILSVPLSGPAIFVSHGGEAFPSLTMVLQGDGVTVDVVGTTFISKAGVTSTTFKTVPDTPFSTFELTLPQGEYSALTALGNLCRQKLTMPTEFLAQNGAEIHEATKVSVSGCPRGRKAKSKAQRGRHRTKASGGRKKR